MSNMHKLIAVFIVCLLISCGNKKKQQLDENTEKHNTSIIQVEDLSSLNYTDFVLYKQSRN